MASGSNVAGSVSVVIEADLKPLQTGFAAADAASKNATGNLVADLSKIEAGAKRTGAAFDGMAESARTGGTATRELSKEQEQAAARIERVRQAAERREATMQRVMRQVAEEERALRTVVAVNDAHIQRIDGTVAAHGRAAAAARLGASANDNFGKSTQIANHHLTNLSQQLLDVGVSLQGGQSPLTVLFQQGAQIAPILGQTGVTGAVKGVGSAILGFLTPAVVTVGALTGAVIYGYSAWSRYDEQQRAVGATLQGLGRQVGLTKAQFEDLATSSAKAANLSVRQASDLGQAYASTGKIGPDNIRRLIDASKDLAATFGADLDGIKDKLASAFSSPAGIERLNEQLRFLDARTQQAVNSLFAQGKAQDAIRLAIERLPPALAKSEEAQGAVGRAWTAIKTAVSDADLAVGKFFDRFTKAPPAEDRLKVLQDRLEAAKRATTSPSSAQDFFRPNVERQRERVATRLGGTLSGDVQDFRFPDAGKVQSSTSAVRDAQSELAKYMETVAATKRSEEDAAKNGALQKSLNDKSIELNKLIKEAGAGSEIWRQYKDWQIAVDDALKSGNPELMKRVDNVKDLSEASSILEHVVKSTTNAEGERLTASEKASRQREIEIRGARAVTTEEKARVAQMQSEERQRGQLVTVQQAQADAEHAAAMVREQADGQLRDMIRSQGLEAEEIRKRIQLLGVDAETRAVAIARQRAEQEITRQGIDLNSSLARSVVAGAEANARLGVSYDRAADAQQRLRDGQRELSQTFATFADDFLLGGQKLDQAFSSLSKTLASSSLKALLTGEGALAGFFWHCAERTRTDWWPARWEDRLRQPL